MWYSKFTSSIVASTVLVVIAPTNGQSCRCEVSDAKEEEFNDLLVLSEDEKMEAEETHLPWGVPSSPSGATNEELLHQTHYILNHDGDLRVPLWAAYRLRDEDLVSRERTECFRRDPRLNEDDAGFCEDYAEPVFDRGHIVPNADMTRSLEAMINTYMFSNMAPQHDRFNRGIWATLESYVRDWTRKNGEIFIITGCIFDQDGDGTRDADDDAILVETGRVAVPTHFYKIILHEGANGFIENISFLLPHVDSSPSRTQKDAFLTSHITTIDTIEGLTGIDFLADLEDVKEKAVEKHKANALWPRE